MAARIFTKTWTDYIWNLRIGDFINRDGEVWQIVEVALTKSLRNRKEPGFPPLDGELVTTLTIIGRDEFGGITALFLSDDATTPCTRTI